MRVLVKLSSVYKSLSYIYQYSIFHSIFSSLWLTYNYNFLKFIQSNNAYFWHHIRWIYAMPFSSEYPFLDVHRTNALETNLMSVYVIRSYVQIASTSKHVVTKKKKKKKIAAKSFSKILCICINMVLPKLVAEVLKF